jgi:hypothetical protein
MRATCHVHRRPLNVLALIIRQRIKIMELITLRSSPSYHFVALESEHLSQLPVLMYVRIMHCWNNPSIGELCSKNECNVTAEVRDGTMLDQTLRMRFLSDLHY